MAAPEGDSARPNSHKHIAVQLIGGGSVITSPSSLTDFLKDDEPERPKNTLAGYNKLLAVMSSSSCLFKFCQQTFNLASWSIIGDSRSL